MNGEEKILELLEQLHADVASVKADVTSVKQGQEKLELGQKELRTHVSGLKKEITLLTVQNYTMKTDVDSVKMSLLNIEHDHLPNIQAALDGVVAAQQKDAEMDHRLRGAEARIEIQGIKQFALKEKLENQ